MVSSATVIDSAVELLQGQGVSADRPDSDDPDRLAMLEDSAGRLLWALNLGSSGMGQPYVGDSSQPAGTEPGDLSRRRPGVVFDPSRLTAGLIEQLTAAGIQPSVPVGDRERFVTMSIASARLLRALLVSPAGGPDCIDRRNAPDPESR